MWDQHVHSRFSPDSEAELADIIENAKRKGLEGICLTDHNDLEYPNDLEEESFIIDWDPYQDEIFRQEFPVHFGVELGLQTLPAVLEGNAEIARTKPLDFIIGSIHLIGGEDPYYGRYFQGKTKRDAYEEYFLCTLDNVKVHSDYDVLGHIDYLIRYYEGDGQDRSKLYTYAEYGDILDEILKTVIQSGKGIEINSSGIRKGCGTQNPITEVIRRYRELGGEILTLGSDAHVAEDVGADLDFCAEVAKSCGFKYYCLFEKRKAKYLPLP